METTASLLPMSMQKLGLGRSIMRKKDKEALSKKVLFYVERDKVKIAQSVSKSMVEYKADLSDEGIKRTWKRVLKEVFRYFIPDVIARKE